MITREIAEMIAKKVEERLEETSCSVVEKFKINGEKAIGISVNRIDYKAAPVIYLDEVMEELTEKMADMIVEKYEEIPKEDLEMIEKTGRITREKVIDNVVFRIINANQNVNLLADVPHFEFLNLAVIYSVPLGIDFRGMHTSFKVTNEIASQMKISDRELYEASLNNTISHYNFEIISMEQMLESMGMAGAQTDEMPLYVCTGKEKMNGAAILLYPQYFHEIAEKEESDLYIIPSSIHEVLAIPTKFVANPCDLKKMCNDVNSAEVISEEQLGNMIYRYRRLYNDFMISC